MESRWARSRTWIWIFVAVQIAGFALDGVWHGLLHPDFEATTRGEMLNHLLTVHLVLYIGVAGLLVSTAWALADQSRRSGRGLAVPVAFAGAAVQTVGEAWHVYTHLQMRPDGLVPASVAFFGLIVAVVAVALSGRRSRRRAARSVDRRRAA